MNERLQNHKTEKNLDKSSFISYYDCVLEGLPSSSIRA